MTAIMYRPISRIFDNATPTGLPAGRVLFRAGEAVKDVFWVRQGIIYLQRHTKAGARLVLHKAGPHTLLAEASVFSSHYHCEAVVIEPGSVAALPKQKFLDIISRSPQLAISWMEILAHGIQTARLKSEIRSLSKVSERLDAWLEAGNMLPERGRLQDVAAELSISREALYRELAKRKRQAA